MPGRTVLSVVGNRPQYIKCAVVSRLMRDIAREVLVDTGQHYDHELAGVFFDQLALPKPDVSLGVGSASHGEQTARMLSGLERTMIDVAPRLVLVYGDTNSTLAGALAAAKLSLPVAHVEAGLRSFDRRMPEEVNRVLADHVSALLFCPTDTAVANLRREGIVAGVHQVGDVMLDLARRLATSEHLAEAMLRFDVKRGAYVFVTVHRPSNADSPERLRAIIDTLSARDEPVVFAAHPRTRASIGLFDLERRLGANIRLVDAVGYFESLALIKGARAVATDSGGIQKEAYFFGVPCVTLRDTSEWVETVQSGWNVLVDADGEALARALADPPRGAAHESYYGEGDAGKRVVAIIADFLASEPA